jgi:RNA-binding protein 39
MLMPQYQRRSPPPAQDGNEDKRSVFVAQLAASLSAQDLGLFFEDKLGRGTVRDARLVYDKSRRSKG